MRLNTLKLLFLLAFLAIVVKLFYWQIVMADSLKAMADKQHLVNISINAPRGSVYSSDGDILATNKPTFVLFAEPQQIKNKDQIAQTLASVIGIYQFSQQQQNLSTQPASQSADLKPMSLEDLQKSLADDFKQKLSQDLSWVALKRNVDINLRHQIEKLQIDGLGFDSGLARFYPESSSAAHILGFVGSDTLGTPTGYFGIEGYYDKELRGIGGQVTEELDARGIPILSGKFAKTDAQQGHDLVLNVDRAVQYIVENKLKEGMQKYGADSAAAIVMEPKTGAILAMASYPNYDPNDFYDFPTAYYTNQNIADSYEPGSTFKVLIMAAGINEGVITPDTTCDICAGPVEASGYYIKTWNDQYFPNTNMTNVLVHSDNTGMTFVARRLGLDKMYSYIKSFGFGSLTGIDLQDEATPDIRDKKDWYDIDLATASFGQGIAVTGIQMVKAVDAIANHGVMMQPEVVKQVKVGDQTMDIQPKEAGRPITAQTAQTVTNMMVEAVNNGEAKYLAMPGYEIAGKTGTAQIAVQGHYDPNNTIASFIGFAPADNPKFIILVRYSEPKSSIYGAETAAPTFFAIAKELFTYYNIPPTHN